MKIFFISINLVLFNFFYLKQINSYLVRVNKYISLDQFKNKQIQSMIKYSPRSPTRIVINSKPQFIGETTFAENDKNYIQSILQKICKSTSTNDQISNCQK